MARLIRESDVDAELVKGVRLLNGEAFKFFTYQAGMMDRIIVLPFLPVWFIELKRPTTDLEPLQAKQRDWIVSRGHKYAALHSKAEVATWLAARAQEIARGNWRE